MNPRTLAVVPAALGAVALLLGPTPSASAARWSTHDPAGDVEALSGDATASDAQADVTRLAVRHGATRVEVEFRVVDLRGRPSLAQVSLRTPGGGRFMAFGVRTRERQFVRVEGRPGGQRADAARIPCGEAEVVFAPRRDEISLSIPRSCLGDPTWVRVNGTLLSVTSFAGDEARAWFDDASAPGLPAAAPRFGPRVRTS